jgi:chaperonin GroEL
LDSSVIIGGRGDKEAMKKRVDDLRRLIENEKSPFEAEKMEHRLADLSTGVAVIKVGAKTEIDMREKLERVKDAIGAGTSARDEGIIVGGGSIFIQMAKVLKGDNEGEKLLREVLEAPTRKIMFNCGEPTEKIDTTIKQIWADKSGQMGYEVNDSKVVNLIDKGVIDPVKVVRLALENAVGVGTSILTTDCTIAVKLEKEDRKMQ